MARSRLSSYMISFRRLSGGAARLWRVRANPRRYGVVMAAAVALTVAGCTFGEPDPDAAGAPPNFPTPSVAPSASAGPADQQAAVTVLAKGLQVPWGIAFLPDGSALVTERDTAKILKVGPESDPNGLKVTAIQTLDEVDAAGEGGLMGIAVSPAYDKDKTVFVYYSTAEDNRVASLVLGGEPEADRHRHPAVRHPQRRAARRSGRTGSCTRPPATPPSAASPRTRPASAARSCG